MSTERVPAHGEIEVRPPVKVRSATEADVDAIVTLINQWAEHGLTLGRDRESVASKVSTFLVGVTDRVVACAAMEDVGEGIGEVRSVSVAHDALGTGAGRLVVEGLLTRAQAKGVDQVVLLTKTPAFFSHLGFDAVAIDDLPPHYRHVGLAGRCTDGRTAMSLALSVAAKVA